MRPKPFPSVSGRYLDQIFPTNQNLGVVSILHYHRIFGKQAKVVDEAAMEEWNQNRALKDADAVEEACKTILSLFQKTEGRTAIPKDDKKWVRVDARQSLQHRGERCYAVNVIPTAPGKD